MNDIIAIVIAQIVLPIVATITTALIGWAATRLRARWGIEIEAKQRDALHLALMTGVQLVLAKHGPGAAPAKLTREVVAYAQSSVPDAIAALRPRDGVLEQLAMAKLSIMSR